MMRGQRIAAKSLSSQGQVVYWVVGNSCWKSKAGLNSGEKSASQAPVERNDAKIFCLK